MPDTYVQIGEMKYNSDTSKVALKYAVKAEKLMKDAAANAVRAAPGFTPDKVDTPSAKKDRPQDLPGFQFFATLTEIVFGTQNGEPTVTCRLSGTVTDFPDVTLNVATVTGSTTFKGSVGDRDVADCIAEVTKKVVSEKGIPYMREQLAKRTPPTPAPKKKP